MDIQKKGRPAPEETGQAVSVSTDMVPKNNLLPKTDPVNLKESPFAEYLFLLPNGEPSYKTVLLFRKILEPLRKRRVL